VARTFGPFILSSFDLFPFISSVVGYMFTLTQVHDSLDRKP